MPSEKLFPLSPDVRCRLCGVTLPGWLPVPDVPDAALLMGHLCRRHTAEFAPLLRCMAMEDLGPVAMEACARVMPSAAPPSSPRPGRYPNPGAR
jgi:hypothetical protein